MAPDLFPVWDHLPCVGPSYLCGTILPVSREVVVQHRASHVHGVRPLADDDAVVWQQLGDVVKHRVVVHG